MKQLFTIIALLLSVSLLKAQEDSTNHVVEDSTVFRWGNSKIIVINTAEKEEEPTDIKKARVKKKKTHFEGIDFGINGFVNKVNSVSLSEEEKFMDLNYGKSIEINFNFMEHYIPIAAEKFGITTGLGLGFNNYDLARDISIHSTKDSTFSVVDSMKNIKKNKFKTIALNLPLLLETNLGKDSKKSFHLAAGGMLSYVFDGKTKQKYRLDGQNYTEKSRTDYNMNPFRLAAHLRIGYGNLTFYGTYSFTSLYKGNKGPELYPFTIGVSLIPF